MTEDERPALIGIVVEPEERIHKPKLVGIELSFYVGKRILIASFATVILMFSLLTIKASKSGTEQLFTIQNREDPNILLSVIAVYLLGVSTDLDLTLPLKMFRGDKNTDE